MARTGAGRDFVAHLDVGDELQTFLARDGEHDRRAALGDWRRRLVDRGLAPSTVKLALAAATSLLDSMALPAPRAPRVEIAPVPSRALPPEQQRAVERETDRLRSSRDRAIDELLLRTGLRIGELAALDAGERAPYPAHRRARHPPWQGATAAASSRSTAPPGAALQPWRTDRQNHPTAPARDHGPLWISRTGEQLSVRSITKLVTKVMAAAGVEETAHGLRHTLATRLVRDHGRDLALVADVLGHADVKTSRRYARSELEDRRAALEALDR